MNKKEELTKKLADLFAVIPQHENHLSLMKHKMLNLMELLKMPKEERKKFFKKHAQFHKIQNISHPEESNG